MKTYANNQKQQLLLSLLLLSLFWYGRFSLFYYSRAQRQLSLPKSQAALQSLPPELKSLVLRFRCRASALPHFFH